MIEERLCESSGRTEFARCLIFCCRFLQRLRNYGNNIAADFPFILKSELWSGNQTSTVEGMIISP